MVLWIFQRSGESAKILSCPVVEGMLFFFWGMGEGKNSVFLFLGTGQREGSVPFDLKSASGSLFLIGMTQGDSMGREDVMEEKLGNSLKEEEKKAEDLQLGAWQAAGIAALLQERGLEALESEDFERAYLYFLFALQFQPFRGVSRRKAIELMPFQKEREALMKEVERLVQEVMAWKEGEKLPSVRCPVCGLSSPFGVRKCLCGYEFVPKQKPPLEISPSTSFKGIFACLLLALFVLVGFQYFQIQSLKRAIIQTLEKQQQKQKQWKKLGKKIEENQDILTGLVTNMAEVIERLDQLQRKEKGEQKKEK